MPTKIQAVTTPALSPARQFLKETLEAQQRALVIEEKAKTVVEAAKADVELARAEAASFSDLDEDVVKSRLAALKGEPGAKTPDEIRDARRNRIVAKEDLHAADETLQVAERELADAHENVERVGRLCASHATGILSECATTLIAQWEDVSRKREALSTVLRALMPAPIAEALAMPARENIVQMNVLNAGFPYGDMDDWLKLQRKIGEALARTHGPRDPGPGLARARSYWKQFADSILADPASELGALPDVEELLPSE